MNNLLFFFDTETTGFPDWKAPSESEHQPHIVQLAALLVDADTRQIVQSMDVICRPDGWTIPDEVAKVHGITTEHATAVGIPESLAIEMFMELWAGRHRVAHNESFDARIIRIALMRYQANIVRHKDGVDTTMPDVWKDGGAECTARLATPIVALPPTDKMRAVGRFHHKTPNLQEAYKHLMGNGFEDAHSALADARACMDVYFAIKDRETEAA